MCWRCAKLLHCPVTHHKMRNAQSWYLDEEQIQNYVLHQTPLLHTASLAAKKNRQEQMFHPMLSSQHFTVTDCSSHPIQPTCHPYYRSHLLVTHTTGLFQSSQPVTHTTGLIYLSPTLQGSSTCHPCYRTHLLITDTTGFIQSSQTVTHTTGLVYLSPTLQDSSTCHPHHTVHPIQPNCHPHYRTLLLVTHTTRLIYLSPTPQGSSNPANLSQMTLGLVGSSIPMGREGAGVGSLQFYIYIQGCLSRLIYIGCKLKTIPLLLG